MGCLRCCCVVCHLYCLSTFLLSTSVHACMCTLSFLLSLSFSLTSFVRFSPHFFCSLFPSLLLFAFFLFLSLPLPHIYFPISPSLPPFLSSLLTYTLRLPVTITIPSVVCGVDSHVTFWWQNGTLPWKN